MYYRITTHRPVTLVFLAVVLSFAIPGAGQDIQTVSHGERIELGKLMVPGKLTLVDFYADWCGPCRVLKPTLEALARSNPDTLAIRKIDIINWDSAVAKQFRIQAIPHLKLFDGTGALLAEGNPNNVLRALNNLIGGGVSGARGGAGIGRAVAPIVLVVGLAALTLFLTFRRQSKAQSGSRQLADLPRPLNASASYWFVMIKNSLEGPFSEEELEEMFRRRTISGTARARRRGQSTWTTVEEVIDEIV